MRNSNFLIKVSVVFSFAALFFAFLAWRGANHSRLDDDLAVGAQTQPMTWLKGTTDEKFAQIEHQLRGFDHAMAEIGYRYGELYFAGSRQNWDYAKYQADKIELIMRLGLERRPKRSASSQPFLNEALPNLQKAIAAKDKKIFEAEMERFHTSCIACHRAENILYYRDAVERIRQQSRSYRLKN
ncbi:MAG: hypothetical protein M3Q78_08060 [Acidobacteriota bacterium]|nr:hypothetical protein [Acidobacteriota bacterium]